MSEEKVTAKRGRRSKSTPKAEEKKVNLPESIVQVIKARGEVYYNADLSQFAYSDVQGSRNGFKKYTKADIQI